MFKRRLLAVFAVLAIAATALVAPSPASAHRSDGAEVSSALSIWRVYVDGPEDSQRLADSGFDLLEGWGDGFLYVLGENDVAVALRQQGFRVERDRDLTPLPGIGRDRIEGQAHGHDSTGGAQAEMSVAQALTYYGGYRTVVEHYAHLDSVASTYPGLATVYDYGDSWLKSQGRSGANDLKVICLTNKQAGDCALSPTSAKPRATIMAAIHARELQTSEMAWRLIDHLTQGYGVDPDVTHMMDTTEIWIIPVANPDGREIVESGGNSPYMQRKNANDSVGNCSIPPTSSNHHGVDLNRNASTHNYGGTGTTTNPCAQTYRGTDPASEPEQQALEALFRNLWPDQKGAVSSAAPDTATGSFITIHSSGQLILLPPGAGGTAPNNDQLRAYAFRMSHYNGYQTGTGPEILYGVTGSTDDWVYYDLGVASVTYELSPSSGTCGGFDPAYSCMDALWNLNRDALLYSVKVAETPYLTSRGPTTTSAAAGSVEQGESATATAVVNDNAYGNSGFSRPAAQTVTQVEYYLDVPPSEGGTPVAMAASDGSFNETNETATASIDTSGLAVGDHTIFVRGRNAAGFWGPIQATSFSVITPTDDPPVADDQSLSTPVDAPLAITLTATDPEGQALTYAVTGGPSNGSLSGAAPNLTYTPDGGFSGSDSFTFTANDGTNTSAPATVSITVGVPVGPIFEDDFETDKGWTTDPDGNDPATTGMWERGNPEATNYNGAKQLGTTTSGVNDLVTGRLAGSGVGSWDIDSGETSIESPPIELPAGASLELSFDWYFAHTSNSSADDYLTVTVQGVSDQVVLDQRANGTDRDAAWQRTTVDISSFAGQTVTLLIAAADGGGGSIVEAGVDSLLIEALAPPSQPPTANSQSVSVNEDGSVAITLTGSDPEGDPLTFSVQSAPTNGTLSGSGANRTYTPNANYNGSDSFTFVANDGSSNSSPATVSITVDPVNDAPTAQNVSASTAQDTAVAVTLDGDDIDGDSLTYTIVSGPSDGSLSGSGVNRTYTPDAGFTGTDSFVYQVSDGTANAQATVTITVSAVSGVVFEDDFETNQGWITNPGGSDTATTGQWEVADPSQTSYNGVVQQVGTTTSGSQALVTDGRSGSSVGTYDIDNGVTSVRSADIALPAGANLTLSFNYYMAHLFNSSSADFFRVTVVGTSGSQVMYEEFGDSVDDAGSWAAFSGGISQFAGQTVYILVEAADASGGSLVEAGIDDLLIEAG